ncbi:hypothetical protein IJG76_00405 [Candidatus Saccharibacteria bacterium]|nr:hypothetical protein [Candidatus Saccharibacteria bacterium]
MKNSSGARNLAILGVVAVVVTLTTTLVALKIYHDTGDIYLDRSRPGYLPEKKEEDEEEEIFEFQDTGVITNGVIKEYLEHFEKEMKKEEYFKTETLSGEALGIPE